ncbi:hypothetical protein OB955_14080 [Halobacteria archaeon AArc-m2/3/4]|uniref:Uncharacterized protein n=1 Tax=Natronoglomus mannanivorans TaxID=2979990 RepID=A0AAP2Z1A6_9EURY|nr:hypothetical protein [Halobacteria archaeon AArc-xg1-1]MCU4973863.1 hypothetical protein [Halobacteria archaeon AArc-m2/3/4]
MSDNPFDDLGGIDDDGSDGDSSETTVDDTVATPSPEQTDEPTRSTDSPSAETTDETRDESTDDIAGPPFEYSEVRQRPLYARGETWDEFEDAVGISVVPELRKEGVRDEEKREIHDAVLSLAVEEPERIVELVLERRRRS